mgnify:FL=1
MPNYRFVVLEGTWAVARLSPTVPVPPWALAPSAFVSITRSHDELSIVCPEHYAPKGTDLQGGWSVIKLLGPFPVSQTGVLASFAFPLAAHGISIFATSTFDTDYILVKTTDLAKACDALKRSGHELTTVVASRS